MHHRARDISGLRVGYLVALTYHGSNGKKSIWTVRCDCGVEKLMSASELKKQGARGVRASCGCKRGDSVASRLRTHGMSQHPARNVWASMIGRCSNPKHPAWHNYGGRGILVCERWRNSFVAFWEDMGATYASGLTLDRRDNSRGYCPENCAWVTRIAQANNTRANRMVGGKTAAQLAAELGIKLSTMYYRLAVGVPFERLGEPPDVSRRFTTSSTAAPAAGLSSGPVAPP